MKRATIFLFIGVLPLFSQAQVTNEFSALLDSVITTSKEVSYYSSTVDWDSLSEQMHQLAENPKEVADLKPAFTLMLNELRDHHGKIMSTSDYSIIAHFTDWENKRHTDEREFLPEHWEVVNDLNARFSSALLPGNIGYLKIVGVGGNLDGQVESERIRAAVAELAKQDVENWIVDLRYNSGGNINVMMAGIAPLFDAETVVSIKDEFGQTQVTADITKGNFHYAGRNVFSVKDGTKVKQPKVAVLTSRWTVSSGELVAVAFKGQENVRFFGEATGGYTTNNGWSVLNDQIAVVISTGVYCDRNGVSYDKNVPVDVEIEFTIEEDRSIDKAIIEATNWLQNE